MLFAIENSMPYLISEGRAYPVEIKDGTVTIDDKNGSMTDLIGRYTEREVVAKLGDGISSIKKRTARKKEEE